MDTRMVLATGRLPESEVSHFSSDLASIKVGEFVVVKIAEHREESAVVHILGNGLLPNRVAKKLLLCSLTSEGGELYRLGWGKVVHIVD